MPRFEAIDPANGQIRSQEQFQYHDFYPKDYRMTAKNVPISLIVERIGSVVFEITVTAASETMKNEFRNESAIPETATSTKDHSFWSMIAYAAFVGLLTACTYIGTCFLLGAEINPVVAAVLSSVNAAMLTCWNETAGKKKHTK